MSASREDTAARRNGRRTASTEPYTLESLVEVAAAAFLERGYDATSMEDLSRAAGITKSSFYHHVSGKEALLRGALDRALDGLFGVLAEPGARHGTPVERLRHIVRRQVEVLATELPYVTLLLRLRGNTETERWAGAASSTRPSRRWSARRARRARPIPRWTRRWPHGWSRGR